MHSTSTRTDARRADVAEGTTPLLDVRDLNVTFHSRDGGRAIQVVDRVSLTVMPGRAHALVGESGSGKSVSMRAVLGLLPDTARVTGEALLDGSRGPRNLIGLPDGELRKVRGRRIGMVFQNAMDAMNPTVTLERQLCEPLLWHGICGQGEARKRAVEALDSVGIPDARQRVKMYPFQLSGGMRQRAMIAMAMIAHPDVIIADEPTTAVDVTLQRQILDLLAELKRQGTAIVMITHDLGVARYLCEDISVLYAGQVMEESDTIGLIDAPRHPYTQGLLGSAVEVGDLSPLKTIPGQPPDVASLPTGCRFAPRCALAEAACAEPQELRRLDDGRTARCWKVGAHA